jgi:hypothetical protein
MASTIYPAPIVEQVVAKRQPRHKGKRWLKITHVQLGIAQAARVKGHTGTEAGATDAFLAQKTIINGISTAQNHTHAYGFSTA